MLPCALKMNGYHITHAPYGEFMIKVLSLWETAQAANDIIDTALATASHASRSTLHCSLNSSPGALVFHCDMFLEIPLIADLEMIRNHCQLLIDDNLR